MRSLNWAPQVAAATTNDVNPTTRLGILIIILHMYCTYNTYVCILCMHLMYLM